MVSMGRDPRSLSDIAADAFGITPQAPNTVPGGMAGAVVGQMADQLAHDQWNHALGLIQQNLEQCRMAVAGGSPPSTFVPPVVSTELPVDLYPRALDLIAAIEALEQDARRMLAGVSSLLRSLPAAAAVSGESQPPTPQYVDRMV